MYHLTKKRILHSFYVLIDGVGKYGIAERSAQFSGSVSQHYATFSKDLFTPENGLIKFGYPIFIDYMRKERRHIDRLVCKRNSIEHSLT